MGDVDEATSKTHSAIGKTTTSRTPSQRSISPSSSQVSTKFKHAPLLSSSSSLGGSPRTSRDPSPTRVGIKSQATNTNHSGSRLSRSRKNSQELGRINVSTIPDSPSPAAIQRALAAAGPARQHSSPLTSDFPNDVPNKSQKSSRTPSATRSIRLTSPPPASTHNTGAKRDLEPPPTPSIIVNQATPKSASSFENIEEEVEDEMLSAGVRSPVRSVVVAPRLEAVQESVDPETPALSSGNKQFITKIPNRSATIAETLEDKASITSHESGSESAGGKSVMSNTAVEVRSTRPALQPRRSYSQMNPVKGKTMGDGTLRNTTVETETVSSVPTTTVGVSSESRNSSGKQDLNSTLRMKVSTETIKPKKEKKKTIRKAPSITSTIGTSKADIFEAKVKSAVEEADSSDSGETFVYESNPPDPVPRRHHSRTPSMTSIASQGDYYRGRYRQDANASLVGKKSMKFANTSKNTPDGEDGSSMQHTPTSARFSAGTGSGQFPRHIGRHGRNPGHLSLFDSDAPFNNIPRSPRKAAAGSLNRKVSPRPHTPKSANHRGLSTGKSFLGTYDIEADDERTPLVSTVRSGRNRRRVYSIQGVNYFHPQPRSALQRFGACACLWSLFSMLVALVVIALVLCSRPLQNVNLKAVENILASDKQLIFDLRVQAMNPNIFGIQITDMNLFVHARSSYVGDSKWWREHEVHDTTKKSDLHARGNIDEGNDPILDDPHLMLLGHVSFFDSPLSFDASPWHRDTSSSVGEVRLDRPGNSTDIDKDRWETVLRHDFDLIVRGVLKYTLPISSHVRSAEISGKTLVKPNILPEPTPEPGKPDKPKNGNGTTSEEARSSGNALLRKSQGDPIRLAKAFHA